MGLITASAKREEVLIECVHVINKVNEGNEGN